MSKVTNKQQKKERILTGGGDKFANITFEEYQRPESNTAQMYMTINSYFNSQRGSR
jgi:hypothetical protein